MLSFECIKNEKSVYFLLTSALWLVLGYFLVMDGQFLVRMNSINQF